MDRAPSIAAIAIMGRHNNPLHIALFPATGSTESQYTAERDQLEYHMMLNSCLDIFEARIPTKAIGHDFGLLHALDERIAMYGWLLNTGVKLVIVVDMEGRQARNAEEAKLGMLGLRGSDLTPAFQALQQAYVSLLRNPFYVPDEHDPKTAQEKGNMQINSPKFLKEVDRIGNVWSPGITAI
ncbi:Trafficking protein particle complex subunit [Sphaerulina musiva]